jgi:hypothetical protein
LIATTPGSRLSSASQSTNRIPHTEMIGEMNGYMHAMLVRRPDYEAGESVLRPVRAYREWIEP